MIFKPKKIISGGQTGADIGGLIGAKRVGITTGGCAPKGYMTETGKKPDLLKSFGLIESASSNRYERTKENIINSDATLIFATNPKSDGTWFTICCCKALGKSYLVVDPAQNCIKEIGNFITTHKPKILNIAGNRESNSKGIAERVTGIIQMLF